MGNKSFGRGFTIVELLIVIVVIGILAAITIVSFSGITSQANVASVKTDLDSNSRKLQLYYTQYGSYPTALDGSNCPSAPTVDSNYCLKLSPGNTVSSYTGAQSTFTLIVAKGSNIVYRITPDSGPVSGYLSPSISSVYSGYDLLFCRYTADCSGVTGISADFSYQMTFTAKSSSKYAVSMLQINNTSTSWTTGTTLSSNISYSTPTAGASFASNIITTTNAGSTAVTFTGTGTLDKTVFVRIEEVDSGGTTISQPAFTKALGVYTTVGTYTLSSPASGNVNYLVVAGGGGGGGRHAGGGGGGGIKTGSTTTSAQNYTVTIGQGGSAAPYGGRGGSGGSSVFSNISSSGGGGGGGYADGAATVVGSSGGSGGGGAGATGLPGGNGSGGAGISGEGNSGGNPSSNYTGAGGGGGGGSGGSPSGNIGGSGGVGQQSLITGISIYYAGGGGGAGEGNIDLNGGPGGAGGGGRGTGAYSPTVAVAGVNSLGGGGGGTRDQAGTLGGSGIVILRLL